MQQLATLFVSLVTLLNTVSPKADLPKVLGVAVNPTNTAVLSLTDEKESGESASVKSSDENMESARLKRLTQLKSLQEKTKESSSEGKVNRDEFKRKLAALKDEKKQQIVSRIDTNIAYLNEKWISQWNKALERLSLILAKIETKSQSLASNGKDTTQLQLAIDNAKDAIENADMKIAEQAVKTYTVNITDEKNLGQNVKTTINSFHNDIKNTRESVAAAKKAVVNALSALKQLSAQSKEETNE